MNVVRILHLKGLRNKLVWFLVNRIFRGANPRSFETKRRLLKFAGYQIGRGTKIVGPIYCTGKLQIGEDCWIGKNLYINGNGSVIIGDRCDIAPEVTFQTGGHLIGSAERRAGQGCRFHQTVGDGVWIGGRSTILNNSNIGNSSVVAGCACVVDDVPPNVLVGGVPARIIKELPNETAGNFEE